MQGSRGPLAPLYVDCANGVGAVAVEEFQKYIGDIFPMKPINTDIKTLGALNSQCGADFVKTKQTLPPSVASAGYLTHPNTRAASFDGDADRLIYYYLRDGKTFRLLDGDKIAVLSALFIGDLVQRANLGDKLKLGVVQTAYANGSSTKFIKQVGAHLTGAESAVTNTTSATSPSSAPPLVSSTSTTLPRALTLVSTLRPTATALFSSPRRLSRPSRELSLRAPTRPTRSRT